MSFSHNKVTPSESGKVQIGLILLVIGIAVVGVVVINQGYLTQTELSRTDVVDLSSLPPKSATPTSTSVAVNDARATSTVTPPVAVKPAPTTPVPTPSPATPAPVAQTPTTPVVTPPAPVTTPQPTLAYKNGTYTVNAEYRAPSGAEEIGITLTIENDVVVGATGEVKTTNGTSKRYQENFLAEFKGVVVGKKLADLKISKVSGASLTTKGFNDAVAEFKTKAS